MQKKITKAAQIRAILAKNPKATSAEIISELATKKIKVFSSEITNARNAGKLVPKSAKKTKKTKNAGKSANISFSDLEMASKFVKIVGMKRAKYAISIIEKIKG